MSIQRFSNLEFQRWDALGYAIYRLIEKGIYDWLVNTHSGGRHRMHGWSGEVGTNRFLPWHRAYLIIFERELRKINPTLSIPYWDWNADRGRLVGFSDMLGRSSGRNLTPTWFTHTADIEGILSLSDYYEFSSELERRPHNTGHVWIGGDMARLVSPRDPAFWFHHAQIDRIWHLWQQKHPDEIANLSETEAELDPWPDQFNIHSINDISDLGPDSYEYVEPGGTTS